MKAPPGSVSWIGAAFFVLLLASPLLLQPWVTSASSPPERTTQDMVLLLQDLAILSSGILLKFEHAASARPALWWLAVIVMTEGMQKLPSSLLAVAGSGEARIGRYDLVSSALVALVTTLLLLTAVQLRRALPVNAFVFAMVLSAGLAAVRLGRSAGLEVARTSVPVGSLVVIGCLCLLAVIVLVVRLTTLPGWFRIWLFVAAALIVISNLGNRRDLTSPAPWWVVACGIFGVALLLTGSVALLRAELRETLGRLLVLTHRAALAEAAERAGRAQVHEVTSAIAGIATAARLLSRADERTGQRRRLTALLDTEMARLDRMVVRRDAVVASVLPLGRVLEPLVRVQGDLGRRVTWTGPDLCVLARPDDVAEIVIGLLSNADRHAPGAEVEIMTEVVGERVQVRVRDNGPGVDRRVRRELFEWGSRGPHSSGQGIGLQVGRELARGLGGELEHLDVGTGATFVLTLPLAVPAAGAAPAARADLPSAARSLE